VYFDSTFDFHCDPSLIGSSLYHPPPSPCDLFPSGWPATPFGGRRANQRQRYVEYSLLPIEASTAPVVFICCGYTSDFYAHVIFYIILMILLTDHVVDFMTSAHIDFIFCRVVCPSY
jgi:hypothetical protein